MTSHVTERFRDLLAELPERVRQQAHAAYRLFCSDPSHPGLRFKKLATVTPTYSARVGLSHRAVATVDGDEVTWFWIGSHADYDRLLDAI